MLEDTSLIFKKPWVLREQSFERPKLKREPPKKKKKEKEKFHLKSEF